MRFKKGDIVKQIDKGHKSIGVIYLRILKTKPDRRYLIPDVSTGEMKDIYLVKCLHDNNSHQFDMHKYSNQTLNWWISSRGKWNERTWIKSSEDELLIEVI
jgi:hypothetical protein